LYVKYKVERGLDTEVPSEIAKVSTDKWICDFLNNLLEESSVENVENIENFTHKHLEQDAANLKNDPKYQLKQTAMMKVIDHHVKIISFTKRLQQLNLVLEISDETKLRKARLPFRGVVHILRTVEDNKKWMAPPSIQNDNVHG